MERTTQRCSEFGHPEFVLHCDDRIAHDLPWLAGLLERRVAGGAVLKPGETLQVGWSVLMVRNAPEGRLSLWELDLSGIAGRLECSVTRTLLVLRRQRAVLESFGILDQMEFPSVQQTVVVCTRFGRAATRMLSRGQASAADSGWFFGCTDDQHDHRNAENLRGGVLYEVACANPDVLDFLAMPAGSVVLLNPAGGVEKAFGKDGQALSYGPGSYLHERNSRS